jgi:hypothetical protein
MAWLGLASQRCEPRVKYHQMICQCTIKCLQTHIKESLLVTHLSSSTSLLISSLSTLLATLIHLFVFRCPFGVNLSASVSIQL